jgi:hypothetical protein
MKEQVKGIWLLYFFTPTLTQNLLRQARIFFINDASEPPSSVIPSSGGHPHACRRTPKTTSDRNDST